MSELLIATKNPGKYTEILEGLKGLPFDFVFLGDLNIEDEDFEEDGETFLENAQKKAGYYSTKTNLPTLAEDSGILVEALKGEMGVKTRRWGRGAGASDEEWINEFLERMSGEKNRVAGFFCTICLSGFGENVFFEGETRGIITEKLLAPLIKGIPLSSCFMPFGCDKVYAGLSPEEKNKISHRGKALMKAREFLEQA
jgi:XTP/dITP diphosphohydrolase